MTRSTGPGPERYPLRALLGMPYYVAILVAIGVDMLWPSLNQNLGGLHNPLFLIAAWPAELLIGWRYRRRFGDPPPRDRLRFDWRAIAFVIALGVGVMFGPMTGVALAAVAFGAYMLLNSGRYTAHRFSGIALILVGLALPFAAGSLIEAFRISAMVFASAGVVCCLEAHREFVARREGMAPGG